MRVEQAVEELGQRQQGLVSARQLSPLVSRSSLSRALRSGRVLQVRPRVYSLAPLPPLPLHVVTGEGPAPAWVSHVRAALLSVSSSAASSRTAAALYGWGLLVEPTSKVDLAVATHHRTSAPQVRVRGLRAMAVVQVRVLPGSRPLAVTDPVTTLLRCCLDLPLLDAVVVCDSALRARALSLAELSDAAARLPGLAGAGRVRRVVELADESAGSVLETVFRVRATLGGLTGLRPQLVIQDDEGRHVLRADFASERARLVIELDGDRWHPDPVRDQLTDNRLAELGWRVLRFRWAQVVHEFHEVLRQTRAALVRDALPLPNATGVRHRFSA